MWLLCDCWRGGSGCWRGGVVLGALLLRRFDARCRTTAAPSQRSRTSPGLWADPLSRPPGLGWILSHIPRVAGAGPLSRPLGWGRVLSHVPWVGLGWRLVGWDILGCAWSFFLWARAAECPLPLPNALARPLGLGPDPLSRPLGLGADLLSHPPGLGPDARSLPRGWVGGWSGGTFWGALGRSSFGRALSDVPAPSDALSLPPGLGRVLSHNPRGRGRVLSHVASRLMSWGLCCVMGFTGVCFWCLGVFCGGGVGVFVVFSGFLGGVGVDLVWGWGACKVIRVAAADAEMMVTDSLQIAGFGGALVRFRVGVGGLGLVCFVRLVRVSLKSCSGAILDPGGCGWCR
ncbi:hypothetical protein J2790_002642 [Paenarthrobacter nicotinovorans]|nr:hypothetical protein [Paenarthrobacter nicotinovorans]